MLPACLHLSDRPPDPASSPRGAADHWRALVGTDPARAPRARGWAQRWALGLAVAAIVAAGAPRAIAGAIDDSTVRVFSIGTVGIEVVAVAGHPTQVASPVSGHGTGFVVADGLVMTAQHVVEDARHVVVRLPGKGGFFPATVVVANKDDDIAILAYAPAGTRPPVLALSTTAPRVRGQVFAIGYPIDPTRTTPQSARGIVAGFLDSGTIQLDMALNPGNSGGPVVDDQDQVVGMAIARGNVEQGVQGIGYAVPPDKLAAAIEEAKQRLGARRSSPSAAPAAGSPPGASPPAAQVRPLATAVTLRESAVIVDGLVQHGALDELRSSLQRNASARDVAVEHALAELIGRTADPDLLVFVAGVLWNVAIAIDHTDPRKLPADLTPQRVQALSGRLRASAVAACEHAVAGDRAVATRSPFVGVALGSRAQVALHAEVLEFSRPTRLETVVYAAPELRLNPVAGSVGVGIGGGLGFAIRSSSSRAAPLIAVSVGNVTLSRSAAEFSHTLVAVELGVIGRYDRFDVTATIAPTWYSSTAREAGVMSSASAWSASLRLGLGYRLGALRLGAGARVLSGPTLWLEPLFGSLVF